MGGAYGHVDVTVFTTEADTAYITLHLRPRLVLSICRLLVSYFLRSGHAVTGLVYTVEFPKSHSLSRFGGCITHIVSKC